MVCNVTLLHEFATALQLNSLYKLIPHEKTIIIIIRTLNLKKRRRRMNKFTLYLFLPLNFGATCMRLFFFEFVYMPFSSAPGNGGSGDATTFCDIATASEKTPVISLRRSLTSDGKLCCTNAAFSLSVDSWPLRSTLITGFSAIVATNFSCKLPPPKLLLWVVGFLFLSSYIRERERERVRLCEIVGKGGNFVGERENARDKDRKQHGKWIVIATRRF